jgi:ABC-type multidrug transport system fused ATPase/permease subunit
LRNAADAAYTTEFIENLPQKFDTNIGDRGTKLSGGQRQRLTIARALYKSPQILIFDEATSALDSKSEKIIQATLSQLLIGRTALIIAHRLSTIQQADEILVLSNGEIIERGTHTELLTHNGDYKKWVALQQL